MHLHTSSGWMLNFYDIRPKTMSIRFSRPPTLDRWTVRLPLHTQGHLIFVCSTAELLLDSRPRKVLLFGLTPAKTLVMSRTLIPASGSVPFSLCAVEARHLRDWIANQLRRLWASEDREICFEDRISIFKLIITGCRNDTHKLSSPRRRVFGSFPKRPAAAQALPQTEASSPCCPTTTSVSPNYSTMFTGLVELIGSEWLITAPTAYIAQLTTTSRHCLRAA